MHFIDCDRRHAGDILAILNDAIVTSTALYDYAPRPPEAMDAWFAAKDRGRFPVIGATDDAGRLLGFASYGTFRAIPGYKYTVEHSLYVARDARGRGLGRLLLDRIVERAQANDVHVLVGVIDAQNAVSRQLHERTGFVLAGTINQVGFKFGRWLDVCFYQRTLATPAEPVDG